MNQSPHVDFRFTTTHLIFDRGILISSIGQSTRSYSLICRSFSSLFHFVTVCSSVSLQTERDVSVRQRAADLLYAMCDRSNAKQIVAEMLSYLETADYSIREEMVGVRDFLPCYIFFFHYMWLAISHSKCQVRISEDGLFPSAVYCNHQHKRMICGTVFRKFINTDKPQNWPNFKSKTQQCPK